MKPRLDRSRRNRSGFTLVELLVSITVLGLMLVGISQMMNNALSATLGGTRHLDADTQARMVLDRMAFDISRITKRADVDYYFQKNATGSGAPMYGNDQMAFYSEAGGYYPAGASSTQDGETSLVGYMIAPMLNGVYNVNGTPQLVRLSKGLVWNGVNSAASAMVFNPLPTSITSNTITSTWPSVATGTDANYQVIGDQVFRLEYCFLVQQSPTSSSITATKTYFYDSPWASGTTPNALTDVTAIVVSIAVLDNKSRALVTPSSLQTAASNLPDDGFTTLTQASTTSSTPLALWKTALTNAISGGGNPLGLPSGAASQVRFYQRYCYLNHIQ